MKTLNIRFNEKWKKSLKEAKKQARIVTGKIDLTKTNLPEEVRIKSEWSGMPTIDINTMKRMPWIDFNHILDNTEIDACEQVIFDILQNNMPDGNDRCYIYHDASTNTFSLGEESPDAEEIDNLATQILIINAKLKVKDLTAKERSTLIKTRKLKIKELRKTFGAEELASALSNNLSPDKLSRLEDTVGSHMSNLNASGRDNHYYVFNDTTEEFEIRIDQDHTLITQIVSAILKLDDKINRGSMSPSDKRRMYNIRSKFIAHLKRIGATELAENL